MKKYLVIIASLISLCLLSQTVTKKYNSTYNQYEYFDSKGQMIGYSKYNSTYGQWEYFEVKQKSPYKYSDPIEIDMSSSVNAATELQRKADANFQTVTEYIDKYRRMNNEMDPEFKKYSNQCLNEIVRKIDEANVDYSNNDEVYQVKKYIDDNMRECVKVIIENTKKSKTNKTTNIQNNNTYEDFYKKYSYSKYRVYSIIENKDGRIIEKPQSNAYVILTHKNQIALKRDEFSDVHYRDISNPIKVGDIFQLSGSYGKVEIDSNMKFVKFYDLNNDCYTYLIKK